MTEDVKGTMKEAGHLGGYVVGGDDATYFPGLWRWTQRALGVERMMDVGCGDGIAVDFYDRIGVRAFGVDGVKQPNPLIAQHDFAAGAWPGHGDYDLVWSCEFVEHVEERYVDNFVAAFKRGRVLLMTHADPGQPGYHHVNCRPADYWIARLAGVFDYDPALTSATRMVAAENPSPWNHYTRSGLAFLRREGV